MAAFLESRLGFGPALSIKARDQLSGPERSISLQHRLLA